MKHERPRLIMTLDDYIVEMVADSAQWFPEEDHKMQWLVLGLCGEAGEVADLIKKVLRGSYTLEEVTPAIQEELIDVFHYWCMLIDKFEVDVEATYKAKREFNVQRFG
jgi:NTP pyrophosphatase (non-canonical NTP hydrolase)